MTSTTTRLKALASTTPADAARYGFYDADLAARTKHVADVDGYFPSWNDVRVTRPRDVHTYVDAFVQKFGVRPEEVA